MKGSYEESKTSPVRLTGMHVADVTIVHPPMASEAKTFSDLSMGHLYGFFFLSVVLFILFMIFS
jgi:hypothetical protein